MRKALIALLLCLASACGSQKPVDRDPRFDPILQSFIQYGKQYGHDVTNWDHISIRFDTALNSQDYEEVGVCEQYADLEPSERGEFNQIKILTSFWDQTDDVDHEIVLLHELGHCLLERDHVETLVQVTTTPVVNSCPTSIMYPYVIDEFVYRAYRDEFIHELFVPGFPI